MSSLQVTNSSRKTQFRTLVFTEVWGVGFSQWVGDEKRGKCSGEAERQRKWEMEWEIDIEMQQRLCERDWEVERKCDLVWVFWTACSICPPWQRGRVTGIGRNWISRLNTPSSSSLPIFSPFSSPRYLFFFSSPPVLPFHWRGEMWWRLQGEMFLPSVAKEPLSQVRLIGWLNIQQ